MPQTDPQVEVSVETLLEDDRWKPFDLQALGQAACRAALEKSGAGPGPFEIAILGGSDRHLQTLNRRFRGVNRATNVLSFPIRREARQAAGPKELGNIALAYETCLAEANSHGKRMAAHVSHLLVHGCLHLVGFDHGEDAEAQEMETLEIASLAELGIQNPYLS